MTTPPPGDGEVCTDCRRINGGVCAVPENCPTAPSEPPAEAQQDNEFRDELAAVLHRTGCADDQCRGHCVDDADALMPVVLRALAARPSADTEKLRRAATAVAALLYGEGSEPGDRCYALARAALDGGRR